MTIGEKIKALRKEQNVTQDKLAEYLNVSYQAVSKWENNTAMPDISFVVPLANFFGVSTDELFDQNDKKLDEDTEKFFEISKQLARAGKVREEIEHWREAVRLYPKNYQFLNHYATSLVISTCSAGFSSDERKANREESISILERILSDCTDDDIRASARQSLVIMYKDNGNYDAAIECANQAPRRILSRENLLHFAYNNDEHREDFVRLVERTNLDYLYEITQSMAFYAPSSELLIRGCEAVMRLWDELFEDGNLLYNHLIMKAVCLYVAQAYNENGDKAKAVEYLKKAKEHIEKYAAIPNGEVHYTSPYFSHQSFDRSKVTKNYQESETVLVRGEIESDRFKNLKDEPEYIELIKSFEYT